MTLGSADFDSELRAAAVAWLDRVSTVGSETVTRTQLESFEFDGVRRPLIAVQQGIWKPRDLTAALSIRTGFSRPGATPPYQDAEGPVGLLR